MTVAAFTPHQCDNELFIGGAPDSNRERCRRHAITVCHHCGHHLCGRCADSCYECGFNFCMGTDCLADHAKALKHQVDIPPRVEIADAAVRASVVASAIQPDTRRLRELTEEALHPTTPTPGHAEGCVCHRCRLSRPHRGDTITQLETIVTERMRP